jgi:hypothetical protein
MSELSVISFPLNLDLYCPELNVFEDVSSKYGSNMFFCTLKVGFEDETTLVLQS